MAENFRKHRDFFFTEMYLQENFLSLQKKSLSGNEFFTDRKCYSADQRSETGRSFGL
jgi:hypothetical protein